MGAGVLLRRLSNLGNVDTGFEKQNAMIFDLDPSVTGYQARSLQADHLYQEIEQRVDAIPGVRSSSFALMTFGGGAWMEPVFAQGFTPTSANDRGIHGNIVGPEFFSAMGIPILAGRTFGAQDTGTSVQVAVINETLAKRVFPGQSPLGKHLGLEDAEHANEIEVVGVVKDAKTETLDETAQPTAYYPYPQFHHYNAGP